MKAPKPYRQKSLRLKGFDYSQEAIYFITILTKNRVDFFGRVKNKRVVLNASGEVVKNEWLKTEKIREKVVLGEWVVMPNHLHALLAFKPVRAHGDAPLLVKTSYKNKFGPQKDNLSSLVRGFKGACTKKIRRQYNSDFAWHRSFYDRIVRNQKELERIEEYILNNPLKWDLSHLQNEQIIN